MLKDETCIKVENYVKQRVSSNRYLHCVSVGETAVFLNRKFHVALNDRDCYKAGVLHDIARNWEFENLLIYCRNHNILMEKEEIINPVLLHAPVGANIVSSLGYQGYESAIRWHTLGSKDMGKLGLLIYLSDYLEPRRTFLSDKERLSYNKMESLEKICLKILTNIEEHLKQKNFGLAKTTEELFVFLKEGGTF